MSMNPLPDRNDWNLRDATPADAVVLGHVHVAAWLETYRGLVSENLLSGLSIEARTRFWKRVVADPTSADATHVHVAEHGGRVIGFGACGPQRTTSFIEAGYAGE